MRFPRSLIRDRVLFRSSAFQWVAESNESGVNVILLGGRVTLTPKPKKGKSKQPVSKEGEPRVGEDEFEQLGTGITYVYNPLQLRNFAHTNFSPLLWIPLVDDDIHFLAYTGPCWDCSAETSYLQRCNLRMN